MHTKKLLIAKNGFRQTDKQYREHNVKQTSLTIAPLGLEWQVGADDARRVTRVATFSNRAQMPLVFLGPVPNRNPDLNRF